MEHKKKVLYNDIILDLKFKNQLLLVTVIVSIHF